MILQVPVVRVNGPIPDFDPGIRDLIAKLLMFQSRCRAVRRAHQMRLLARNVMDERQRFSHLRDELSLFVQFFILMSHAMPADIMPFTHRALHITLPAAAFQIGSCIKKWP